jgi:hypothetical protein
MPDSSRLGGQLLGKARNPCDNPYRPRETLPPQGGRAARSAGRNKTPPKTLNRQGSAKSPASPNRQIRNATAMKRNRRLRFHFVWFRFVSPERGESRRGNVRLESATGFGA